MPNNLLQSHLELPNIFAIPFGTTPYFSNPVETTKYLCYSFFLCLQFCFVMYLVRSAWDYC